MARHRIDVQIFRDSQRPGVRKYKLIDMAFEPTKLKAFLRKLYNYKEFDRKVIAEATAADDTLTIMLNDLTHPWELLERHMSFWISEALPGKPTIHLVIAQ